MSVFSHLVIILIWQWLLGSPSRAGTILSEIVMWVKIFQEQLSSHYTVFQTAATQGLLPWTEIDH